MRVAFTCRPEAIYKAEQQKAAIPKYDQYFHPGILVYLNDEDRLFLPPFMSPGVRRDNFSARKQWQHYCP